MCCKQNLASNREDEMTWSPAFLPFTTAATLPQTAQGSSYGSTEVYTSLPQQLAHVFYAAVRAGSYEHLFQQNFRR